MAISDKALEVFKIPKVKDLPAITPPMAQANDKDYQPYKRNAETLVRQWAIPGTEGLRRRIGGLEKLDGIGTVSMDPMNHQKMCEFREKKVEKVADFIPDQKLIGDKKGELLVVSWGGTFGSVFSAVKEMQAEGKKVSLAHFRNICPLPKNTKQILSSFDKILVCELNLGQFVKYLRINFPEIKYHQYNKIQGLPFMVNELKEQFNKLLEEK